MATGLGGKQQYKQNSMSKINLSKLCYHNYNYEANHWNFIL